MASLYQSLGIAPRDKAYIVGHLAGGVGAAYAARDDESRRLSNHDRRPGRPRLAGCGDGSRRDGRGRRSEEHTSELQSRLHLVCRLLLEKKKKKRLATTRDNKTSGTRNHNPSTPMP